MFDIEVAQPLQRAVDIDRIVEPHVAQFGNHPLRLAQRIGTEQHAAFGLGAQPRKQLVDFVMRLGMAKHRQPERCFGDEHVARHRLKRRAGGIGAPLVIARHDDTLTAMFEQYLRRSQHMAGGHEGDIDIAEPQRLAISDRMPRLLAIAHAHDRERFGRRPNRAMPAARMIGMTVRHQRARHRFRRVHPGIGGGNIDPLGPRFDPAAKCHRMRYGDFTPRIQLDRFAGPAR